MSNKIEIEEKLRPCYVFEHDRKTHEITKHNALFYRWVGWKGLFNDFCECDVRGLVEYEDGIVDLVKPKDIKFLDPRHNEYDFRDKE